MDSLEKEKLTSILGEFSNEDKIQERIKQVSNPLDSIDDKWVKWVPAKFVAEWESLPIETKCLIQGFCLRIADLQSEIDAGW